ncbi:lysozyme C-like isoform X2 [Pollicipes pollicipes]|uniref:lysozyme C-like isoform X2 n=2 Tax=Pollicipes pollicipes TaxID=41117 RepID=UPI001884BCDF|nr:lysozyme C-like isoform X2 [Pollicipes pollicipes]
MARMGGMLAAVSLLLLQDVCRAMVYERCQLVNELRRKGVPEKDLSDWVCLAYHESRYDTNAEGRLNWDNSVDHGLFQISDIYWCDWRHKEPGRRYKNMCRKSCDAFHDNDITDDLACVMMIHKEHQRLQGNGFMAWTAWKNKCRGSDMTSYTIGCDRTTSSTTTTTSTDQPNERTNAHTHFNNLAPLFNQLVRTRNHDKETLNLRLRRQR